MIVQTITDFNKKGGETEVESDGRPVSRWLGDDDEDRPDSRTDNQLQAITRVLSGLAEMGFQGLTASDLVKLLPPDEMEPALIIMADVRAYFQGELTRAFFPVYDSPPW